MELVTDQRERVQAAVQPFIDNLEAGWMQMYVPSFREYDPSLELFLAQAGLIKSTVDLSHTSVAAISVFGVQQGHIEGSYSQWTGGLLVTDFAHGVSSIAALIEDDQVVWLGELLDQLLDEMAVVGGFPSLDERLGESYAGCVEAILTNGEPTTQRQLLSYNMGVWWAMGHIGGIDTVRIGSESDAPSVWRFVQDTWMSRIERGVVDQY